MSTVDRAYLKAQLTMYSLSFDSNKIETVIDGCHVTMNFPGSTDNSSLQNIRNTLKRAYLNSLTG
jgi:hypothetical protein